MFSLAYVCLLSFKVIWHPELCLNADRSDSPIGKHRWRFLHPLHHSIAEWSAVLTLTVGAAAHIGHHLDRDLLDAVTLAWGNKCSINKNVFIGLNFVS